GRPDAAGAAAPGRNRPGTGPPVPRKDSAMRPNPVPRWLRRNGFWDGLCALCEASAAAARRGLALGRGPARSRRRRRDQSTVPVGGGRREPRSLLPVPSGVTEYPAPPPSSGPHGTPLGPDNNLWVTEQTASKVAKVTPAGSFTEYALT